MLDQVGTSCNRPFGVRAQIIRTTRFLLTADYTVAQRKLDCFFRLKVPRLEERVQDDGNSEKLSEKQVSTKPGVSNQWKSMIGKPIDQSISIDKIS